MANEIIIRKPETLGKSKLGTITKKIIDLGNKEIENEKTRAQLITQVIDEEMFKPAFETASEWAEKFLSINKSTLSRLLSVTRRFANVETTYTDENGFTFNVWADFTLSQMFEMYKATDEEIETAGINPEMTCKEIRAALKAKSEMLDISDGAETETEPATAESFDTETEEAETEETETNGHTVTYMCDKSFNDINKVFEYIAENSETADILIKKRGEWYSIYKSTEQI